MPRDNAEDLLLEQVAEWLKEKGWTVSVISLDKIQGPVDRAFNYEVVFRFTGVLLAKTTKTPEVS